MLPRDVILISQSIIYIVAIWAKEASMMQQMHFETTLAFAGLAWPAFLRSVVLLVFGMHRAHREKQIHFFTEGLDGKSFI